MPRGYACKVLTITKPHTHLCTSVGSSLDRWIAGFSPQSSHPLDLIDGMSRCLYNRALSAQSHSVTFVTLLSDTSSLTLPRPLLQYQIPGYKGYTFHPISLPALTCTFSHSRPCLAAHLTHPCDSYTQNIWCYFCNFCNLLHLDGDSGLCMLVIAIASLTGGNKGSQRLHLTERACALHNLPIKRNKLVPFYQSCLMLRARVALTIQGLHLAASERAGPQHPNRSHCDSAQSWIS